jgi:hypothetical protein
MLYVRRQQPFARFPGCGAGHGLAVVFSLLIAGPPVRAVTREFALTRKSIAVVVPSDVRGWRRFCRTRSFGDFALIFAF